VDAFAAAGYTVEVTQRFETFARLAVTDPAVPDRPYKVELAAKLAGVTARADAGFDRRIL
jgi:hypothetical protein